MQKNCQKRPTTAKNCQGGISLSRYYYHTSWDSVSPVSGIFFSLDQGISHNRSWKRKKSAFRRPHSGTSFNNFKIYIIFFLVVSVVVFVFVFVTVFLLSSLSLLSSSSDKKTQFQTFQKSGEGTHKEKIPTPKKKKDKNYFLLVF